MLSMSSCFLAFYPKYILFLPIPPVFADIYIQMRDEILRARSSLLASKESAKVESVIRLLEQTYERLQDEGEENVVPSAKQDVSKTDHVFMHGCAGI
jgi:hypothetical protein